MKNVIKLLSLSSVLLFSVACSNDNEDEAASNSAETEAEETEVESESSESEEANAESEEAVSENDLEEESVEDDSAEEPAEETEEASSEESGTDSTEDSPFSPVSDNDKALIEQKYQGRTNDGFISSIETQNDEYSELVVYVTDKFDHINEEGYRSKLEGIGTSIREMTSGILYDNQEGTLPTLEFRNADDEVIGTFNSHARDERMEFN